MEVNDFGYGPAYHLQQWAEGIVDTQADFIRDLIDAVGHAITECAAANAMLTARLLPRMRLPLLGAPLPLPTLSVLLPLLSALLPLPNALRSLRARRCSH